MYICTNFESIHAHDMSHAQMVVTNISFIKMITLTDCSQFWRLYVLVVFEMDMLFVTAFPPRQVPFVKLKRTVDTMWNLVKGDTGRK